VGWGEVLLVKRGKVEYSMVRLKVGVVFGLRGAISFCNQSFKIIFLANVTSLESNALPGLGMAFVRGL
jgi:hypothetical protein